VSIDADLDKLLRRMEDRKLKVLNHFARRQVKYIKEIQRLNKMQARDRRALKKALAELDGHCAAIERRRDDWRLARTLRS
jgi:predicted transcriptional regulator